MAKRIERRARAWLALIDQVMLRLYQRSFVFEGQAFVTSRGLGEELFVRHFLIQSGVLTPLGRIHSLTEKPRGTDPIASIDRANLRQAVLDRFYPKPAEEEGKKGDTRLYNRILFLVDTELFDQIRHWELWSRNDGAEIVSELTIRACLRAHKRLTLTNPTESPDAEWTE
jgi:hypothetical protein